MTQISGALDIGYLSRRFPTHKLQKKKWAAAATAMVTVQQQQTVHLNEMFTIVLHSLYHNWECFFHSSFFVCFWNFFFINLNHLTQSNNKSIEAIKNNNIWTMPCFMLKSWSCCFFFHSVSNLCNILDVSPKNHLLYGTTAWLKPMTFFLMKMVLTWFKFQLKPHYYLFTWWNF